MISTITIDGVEYTKPNHKQFIRDMRKAGLDVELYHGRHFYHGPSVVVDSVQEAVSRTRIQCVWDNMGHKYVVHPRVSDDDLGRIGRAA